jgi:hypothetical protein
MERKIYLKNSFKIGEKTGFICPICNDGKLDILEKNVHFEEYKNDNKEAKKHEDFDIEWLKHAFHGFLKCNNCDERIVFSGKTEKYYSDFEENGSEYCKELYIEYIERPPHIIEISSQVPQDIKDLIIDSFKLFWLDINSCANKIRVCLEILMDKFKIKKIKVKNGKQNYLPLHERIEIFTKNDVFLKDILISIKLIGNYASHKEKITKNDLLDGYYLLEYALKKLYDDKEKEILHITKSINKRKKPRSKIG